MSLILKIELYFTINALLYNDDYLSELFNSNKKDNLFSFIQRRTNQVLYILAINGSISLFFELFFPDEEKFKRIFLRNKNNEDQIKTELELQNKEIKKNCIILIVLNILLSAFFMIYISCFNFAYPYIKREWMISSIFIFILMQAINFILIFFETCVRYISLKFSSPRLFTLSQVYFYFNKKEK